MLSDEQGFIVCWRFLVLQLRSGSTALVSGSSKEDPLSKEIHGNYGEYNHASQTRDVSRSVSLGEYLNLSESARE